MLTQHRCVSMHTVMHLDAVAVSMLCTIVDGAQHQDQHSILTGMYLCSSTSCHRYTAVTVGTASSGAATE